MLKKKGPAGIMVTAFIGALVVSSMTYSVVGSSSESAVVELTTQMYDVSGDITQTVRVTPQQIKEITAVFENLRIRLSTAESMEETQKIFDDTIVSLSSYDLLPDGMSIDQAQRLVTRGFRFQNLKTKMKIVSLEPQGKTQAEEIQSTFCSVAGNASNMHVAKLAKRIALRLFVIMDYCTENVILSKLATALWIVCNQCSKINDRILQKDGYHTGVSIYFGNYHYYPYPDWLSPAKGWISTSGLNGNQNLSGSFWGQHMIGGWQPQDDWHMNYTWRGCEGFTGLILYTGTDSMYFLGSALHVHIGTDRP